MALLVLTLCLLGVVSSLPVEVEQALVQEDGVQAQLKDDVSIEQDQDHTIAQKENVRKVRQYDPTGEAIMAAETMYMPMEVPETMFMPMEAAETMYMPRVPMEAAESVEDCVSPYYGRTHLTSMPILSGLSSFSNIIPEAHASTYATSTTAGIRRGPFINQGAVSSYGSSLGSPLGSSFGSSLGSPLGSSLGSSFGGSFPYPHDAQLSEQHQSHTFFTTVPYISGYRMSPIYSEKQIVVRDYSHPEYHHPHSSVLNGGPTITAQAAINPQGQYTARSLDDSMLSKGMDFNVMFGRPFSAERSASELRSAEDYDKAIEDVRQRLEHLESLRQSLANVGVEDSSEPKDQTNFV